MNWKLVNEQVGYDAKDRIKKILDSKYFKDSLYVDINGNSLNDEKRAELGQFYTPGKICIKMIEKFKWETLSGKNILDPTVGSGNLLIACLIAGADSDRIFGNEYDADIIPTCRNRINKACDILGKPHIQDWQIHQGNALQARCLTEFGKEYDTNYNPEYIDDLEYAQSYEYDEEQTFLGETSVYHVHKLSWADENREAQERLEKKQQLEKRNTQKAIEETEKAEQVDLFGKFFGGN